MTRQLARNTVVSGDHNSTVGKTVSTAFDVATTNFAYFSPAIDHPAGVNHGTDNAENFGANAEHGLANQTVDGANENWIKTQGDHHAIDAQHVALTSGAEFVDTFSTSPALLVDTYTVNDGPNNDHLSALYDPVDSLTDGLSNSSMNDGYTQPAGHSFDSPEMHLPSLPDVFSDAKSHGIGGGGGSGGHGTTAPSPYTTNSGTGVDIHITYDSSVGNAPTGFTSVVQKVADFFASSLQDLTQHITINIDVGYGEVDGMRLGAGALGESVTNLQQVTYSNLQTAYSASDLSDVSLGASSPSGNLYVSFAEAKALNIAVSQTVDGYVGFSSQSGIFDYNNTDGVSSNQYDFFGVVAHEFSEVMGRLLLVGASINNAPSYMAYDLFHYSGAGVQDFSGNGGYFSTDLGKTILAYFNNASNGGDAGDWASTGTSGSPAGGSVYDAFNAFGTPGQVAPVSNTDLLALHAVGFDLVHPVTA